jgi:ElaA protein
MKKSTECIFKEFNTDEIIISAQKYLEKFYNELGFVSEGEPYPEDDIPHIKMRLKKG